MDAKSKSKCLVKNGIIISPQKIIPQNAIITKSITVITLQCEFPSNSQFTCQTEGVSRTRTHAPQVDVKRCMIHELRHLEGGQLSTNYLTKQLLTQRNARNLVRLDSYP